MNRHLHHPHRTDRGRLAAITLCVGLLAALLTAGLASATTAPAAAAAARITVTNGQGGATADVKYRTELTIRGTGFQAVKGGFGGVYLMFGWVKPGNGWKPSKGGVTGTDYRYIPDSEDANNQGYLKFIANPGSSTAGEAHAVLKGGSFQVKLTVPGPTFQSVDRNGKVSTVDCTKVTCGVITIGAHGVKNPANETFTPVRFANVYDAAPAGQDEAPASTDDAASTTETTEQAATPKAKKAKAGAPALVTDRLTAKVGNTMAFTASGFSPGEQVVGVLDDGVAGIGPMVAGPSGEIAGVLPLPLELEPGTHELRLSGAASGSVASERFAVRPADAAAQPAADRDTDDAGGIASSRLFLVIAGCVFLLALITFVLIRLIGRSRRPRTAAATAGGA